MSVSKPLPHDAAELHVTGQARYIDDIPVPADCLHLAFGLSDIAFGDLKSVNVDQVRQAPGVVAVLTAADLPFENDVSPAAHDEPLLATTTVQYVGQPVFLVVADSHLNARKAARLGQLDISEKPPIVTIDQALKAGSRFEEGPLIWSKGDAKTAIAKAPHMLNGSIDMGGQEHFYLEGQAALALPQENGDMLVHSSTQHPTEIQHKCAEAIGRPMNAIRVEVRRMGGGFGGKESQANALAVACAVAALRTKRPCKMRYDRDDDMTITGKRHDFRIDYKVGFDDTGRILGVDFLQLARCGWAMDLSLPVADRAMLHADNAYNLENVRIESHRLKTNTQSATAFRGFGGPQGILGVEAVIEQIAHELEIDPLAVRRENYYQDFHQPQEIASGSNATGPGNIQTTPYSMPVEDCIINKITDALEVSSDYQNRRKEISVWNDGHNLLKKGISLTPVKFGISFTLTHLNQAGALVHIYQDGSVHLNHGGTEMGQGLFQKVAQVAATTLGIDVARVKITATDTAKVPNTSATAASSGTDLNGMAVKAACEQIQARMRAFLQKHFGSDGAVFQNDVVQLGEEKLGFSEAAMLCYQNRVSLSATGFYKTPKIQWDRIAGQGRPFLYFAYGAAVSEVVIDTLTGENRLLRVDILHDAGTSLNPALDIGQIEGGFVQGAGWLTMEELVWDDAGRLRTHAPSTYKIPACSDRPDIFNVELWDGRNREETIFRSKAVGEPPFNLGISTFMALSNAASACGSEYPNLRAPATSEAVLAAVNRARK